MAVFELSHLLLKIAILSWRLLALVLGVHLQVQAHLQERLSSFLPP
jgi:hypothetical protein